MWPLATGGVLGKGGVEGWRTEGRPAGAGEWVAEEVKWSYRCDESASRENRRKRSSAVGRGDGMGANE